MKRLKKEIQPIKKDINEKAVLLGGRIKIALNLRGWNQKQFAEISGFKEYEISRWICGQYPPNALELKTISDLTGQPLEFFYKD